VSPHSELVTTSRTYRVAELAAIAGVTVRTLHHYDALGLLVPNPRSRAGYRLYSEQSLLRLQQILIQRELGLPLEQIRRILDDPAFDLRRALRDQKAALEARATNTRAMLQAVNAALSTLDSATPTTQTGEHTMQDLFRGFNPERYADETRERWGHTDAYREAARRTKNYTKEDWQRFREEQAQVYRDLVHLMQAGCHPAAPEVAALVERHRLLIDQWCYPCSVEMHVNLAGLYEADSRFTENMDSFGRGLTRFLVAAIHASND
jgi:DNA-binding transcriptional MerR regulator